MRVLFCSLQYYPEAGGLSVLTDLLCRELLRVGWQVEVATATPAAAEGDALPYPVRRGWSTNALRRRMRQVDCVVMEHLSIRHLLPLWLSSARSLTILHAALEPGSMKAAVYATLFRWHLRLSQHTAACSEAVRRHVPGVRAVLFNPYDDALFHLPPGNVQAPRQRLAFLGRVVSVKGVEFAIEALGVLRARGHDCDLTIIGDGPSLPEMRRLAQRLEVEPWITFCGNKRQEEIPDLLRGLGTLLVPSNYFEAFGLVALEAIACGMDVVVFRRGGLPEAVGRAGLVCEENTARGLADMVERLLGDPVLREELHAARAAHLEPFRKATAAARYREVISAIVRGEPEMPPMILPRPT